MERREAVTIIIEGRGEVTLHYRYKTGPAHSAHEIQINANDLATLVELTGSPNLSQMGFKLAVNLSFNNAPQQAALIELPEEVMLASSNRLREMAAESGDQ